MGLDEGWVTGPALALPRTLALRVLGNGVVPQQAAVALRLLLCPRTGGRCPGDRTSPTRVRPAVALPAPAGRPGRPARRRRPRGPCGDAGCIGRCHRHLTAVLVAAGLR